MKKYIFLALVIFTITACKNNSEIKKQNNIENPTMSKSESNQKLIDACKTMDGILDADIKDDILTIRANISKEEAQKLSDGMLSEIRKYNQYINTVIVCDLGYNLLGYSGK